MEYRYLFKAKRIDNGQWVGGYIARYGHTGREKYYIIPSYASDLYSFLIDKNTICQCTGLKDKNGKEIYEGDIVNCEKRGPAFYHSKVIYNAINARYEVVAMGCPFPLRLEPSLDEDISIGGIDYEVIGNIYENPELLNQLNIGI